MAKRSYILFPQDTSWRIAVADATSVAFDDVAVAPDASPVEIAGSVASALQKLGIGTAGVTLALPSGWCVAATFPTNDISKIDRKALLYRLEERLPTAVEELTADFIMLEGRALGVCAALNRIRPLVDALEEKHVSIESVSPAALLAGQQLLADPARANLAGRDGVLLIGEGEHVNLMIMESGRLADWSLLPRAADEARLQLDVAVMAMREPPGYVLGLDVPAEWLDLIGVDQPITTEAAQSALVATVADGSIYEQAATAVGRAAAAPWIELRRGQLAADDRYRMYRGALNAALASAAVLLLALTVAFFVRAQRYTAAAEEARRQTESEFHALYPGATVPPNVRLFLESETRKRQESIAGAASGTGGEIERRSAMETLQLVLGSLPPGLPVRIENMTFSDTSFLLQGRCRASTDIDAIASAVRKAGLTVPDSRVVRDNDGYWAVNMSGARPALHGRGKPAVAGGDGAARSANANGGPP